MFNIHGTTVHTSQVKIDGPVRARYFNGTVTGSEPVTGPL